MLETEVQIRKTAYDQLRAELANHSILIPEQPKVLPPEVTGFVMIQEMIDFCNLKNISEEERTKMGPALIANYYRLITGLGEIAAGVGAGLSAVGEFKDFTQYNSLSYPESMLFFLELAADMTERRTFGNLESQEVILELLKRVHYEYVRDIDTGYKEEPEDLSLNKALVRTYGDEILNARHVGLVAPINMRMMEFALRLARGSVEAQPLEAKPLKTYNAQTGETVTHVEPETIRPREGILKSLLTYMTGSTIAQKRLFARMYAELSQNGHSQLNKYDETTRVTAAILFEHLAEAHEATHAAGVSVSNYMFRKSEPYGPGSMDVFVVPAKFGFYYTNVSEYPASIVEEATKDEK